MRVSSPMPNPVFHQEEKLNVCLTERIDERGSCQLFPHQLPLVAMVTFLGAF